MKEWMGDTTCDFCRTDLTKQPWFVDGKTTRGPWALMCPTDYRTHGVGMLGRGLGQKYNGTTLKKMEG
jgi:hypothetical protein